MTRLLALALLAGACATPALAPFPPDAAARTDDRLVALYQAVRDGGDPAEAAAPGLTVIDGAVRIEATAAADGAALAAALGRLGLTDPAVAGGLVNGMLPVASLAQAAALAELRYLAPVIPPVRPQPTPPERY